MEKLKINLYERKRCDQCKSEKIRLIGVKNDGVFQTIYMECLVCGFNWDEDKQIG